MEAAAVAAALTVRSTSQCLLAASAPPVNVYRRAAAATQLRAPPCGRRLRVRALPPELSEILNPKLVPGSPSDTGDVSSLIPVSALMLLFYFVSNWVVPELVMKRLQRPAEDDATAAASMPSSAQQGDGDDARKLRKKGKKTKSKKETIIKV